MTRQNPPPADDRTSSLDRERVIAEAVSRLEEVQSRVKAVSAHIDTVLCENGGLPWDHFEAAHAQLLVFLLRAERQVGALQTTETGAWGDLLNDLEHTWGELALASQRLVCRLAEAADAATAGRPDNGEPR